jgi:hypothetical protein
MSDDSLNSARLHLSEAAQLAGTMASGFKMKSLTRALNRCNPISVNPRSPQGYADNPFEGGNVGAPAQSPQYSVGSYPEGRAIEANFAPPPLPATEYPGDTIPPALPDPCQGMREALAACSPPSTYCPSFMGQPTGEVRPLAGTPQPADVYSTLHAMANRYSDEPSSHLDMTPQKARKILSDGSVQGHPLTDAQRGVFGAVAGRDDNAAYSYPQNPDGRIQGPMNTLPESDFLAGRFGPGIHKMRQQLQNCRR